MAEDIQKTTPEKEKQKLEDSEIIIYHNDIDGAVSAYIVKQAKKLRSTSKNVTFVSYDHNNFEEARKKIRCAMRKNSNLYFVDVAPKLDFLNELMAPNTHGKRKVASINIIDHHESAMAYLSDYKLPIAYDSNEQPPKVNITIDPEAPSAAKLVWNTLMGVDKKVPDYVAITDKMDRNNLKCKDDFAAAAYIDTKPVSTPEEALKTVTGIARINFNTMVERGRPIIAAQKQVISQLMKSSTVTDIEVLPAKTIKVPMVNADVKHFGRQIDKHLIELGEEKGKGLAFAWYQQASGKVAVSIRSSGEIKAGDVAKYLTEKFNIEGGGHANSAAVVFPSLCQFERSLQRKNGLVAAKKKENSKETTANNKAEINIDIKTSNKPTA